MSVISKDIIIITLHIMQCIENNTNISWSMYVILAQFGEDAYLEFTA